MRLTKDNMLNWLKTKDPKKRIGVCAEPTGCVIAQFLVDNGAKNAVVFPGSNRPGKNRGYFGENLPRDVFDAILVNNSIPHEYRVPMPLWADKLANAYDDWADIYDESPPASVIIGMLEKP